MSPKRLTLPGYPLPLGATSDRKGVQFALFSRHATSVTLVFYNSSTGESPSWEIVFDPSINKTGDIWHIWVEGLKAGQLYGYRIQGPYEPELGHRFNHNKLLLDPYARAVSGNFQWDLSDARGYDPGSPLQDMSFSSKDSAPGAPKCIVVDSGFDWFDRPVNNELENTIIYELHVKGFTQHESSGCAWKGTFRGLTEKIPYLKELGITAVELMPIQEFDEDENVNINPVSGERLKNYWGYSTMSFFAPKGRFSSSGSMGEQYQEFKEMVRDFHHAGIEVILDIVFNHTAEGDHLGPTMCFRGIDNSIYYMLEDNRRLYKNFSGCGNTINCNHPLVRDFILDCLKYWVVEMHVDGFRFDLASILGRNQDGTIASNPPLLERIAEDPILRKAKIIAEAWDAGGAYQVGDFPGRWAEWNGKFRDDVRLFWKGEKGCTGSFATRLCGSEDLYYDKGSPLHSINFVTCHDGFTLHDLVTYSKKRNIENGENNLDGSDYEISWNSGFEGPGGGAEIETLRIRQIKNLLVTLFVSQGIPMLLAGDEFLRTQNGNNNAYCQDNEISWIDWSHMQNDHGIYDFCRKMIEFRKRHPVLRKKAFFRGDGADGTVTPDISWHGTEPGRPDWSYNSHLVACLINGKSSLDDYGIADNDLYMIFNASPEQCLLSVPHAPSGRPWKTAIDTSQENGAETRPEQDMQVVENNAVTVEGFSTVVLIS